jgi:hypothetical protein
VFDEVAVSWADAQEDSSHYSGLGCDTLGDAFKARIKEHF